MSESPGLKEERGKEKRDLQKNRRSIAMPFALVTQSTTDNGTLNGKWKKKMGS
jgi:hypothetical protein